MSVVVPAVAFPAALRSVAVARNLMLLLSFRAFMLFRESFQLTFTIPSPGTVNDFVPRLMRRLEPSLTFDADRRPIVPESLGCALKL